MSRAVIDLARFDAAIVDLDGTMVDTVGDFDAALNRMLADLGQRSVNRAFIENSVISKNTSFSVRTNGAGARATLNKSTLRGATLDLDVSNSGSIASYQNNVIGAGAPSQLLNLE